MKSPTWRGVAVHTSASLARAHRRLDRRRSGVQRALEAMRRGATLHLTFGSGREWWILSTGWTVPPDVAAILIGRSEIQAVGDALFPNQSQTWRYATTQDGGK
jgi:hypothetical protein